MSEELFIYALGLFVMLMFIGIIIHGIFDSVRMEMYGWTVVLIGCLVLSLSCAGYSVYMIAITI